MGKLKTWYGTQEGQLSSNILVKIVYLNFVRKKGVEEKYPTLILCNN
jgi:hypothetical protein